jgi:hypothetical protein
VRLLLDTCMLLGLLLPVLRLWADSCGNEPGGSVLRRKLWRKLLSVLPSDHADTIRRCSPCSNFRGIYLVSFWISYALPNEVRNQKEAQDTRRRL